MGAKRKVAVKSRQHINTNYDNVINIKPMGHSVQKKTQVTILPRNRNQETYVLALLDPKERHSLRSGSGRNRQNHVGCASSG